MAKSNLNFEKANATGHSETHNLRKDIPKYLLPKEHHLGNEYWQDAKKPKELFDEELAKAERRGGRIPQFKNSYWEGVLNLNKNHTMKDCKKVAEYIEKEYNVICTGIFIHRDEGYINERGVVEYNLHAHLTFVTYKDSKQNWRQTHINKKAEQMQTDVANIMQMERGKKSGFIYEEKQQIKAKVGKFSDYPSKQEYNKKFAEVAEELGFKNRGKARKHLKPGQWKEQQELLQQVLKDEMKDIKAQMQKMKAERKDYAKLEAENKELKQKQSSFFEEKTRIEFEKIQAEIEVERLKEQKQELQDKNTQLETTVNALKSKNKALDEELLVKKDKIVTSQLNLRDYEVEIKDLKKEYQEILEKNQEIRYEQEEELEGLGDELGLEIQYRSFVDFKKFVLAIKNKFHNLMNTIKELLAENNELKKENEELRVENRELKEVDEMPKQDTPLDETLSSTRSLNAKLDAKQLSASSEDYLEQESDRIKELKEKLENETLPIAKELIQLEIKVLEKQEAHQKTSTTRKYR